MCSRVIVYYPCNTIYRFKLTPQKRVCQKWSSNNDPAPTNTPIVVDPSNPQFNDTTPPGQDSASTVFATVTLLNTATELKPSPSPTNSTPQIGATAPETKVIAAVASASVVSLLAVFLIAWIIQRREKLAGKQVIAADDTVENSEVSVEMDPLPTTAPQPPTSDLDIDVSTTAHWLPELDPEIQRRLAAKHASSNIAANTSTVSAIAAMHHKPNSNVAPLDTVDEKFTQEIEPSMQRFIHREIISEAAPTSNINLENHLHRLYGTFSTWNHELVMEWARLKRLEPAVIEILRNYQMDGQLLATMDIHSLKDKCDVQDFRLRAKFMQGVEFLKDSSQLIANSTAIDNVDGDSLPQYEVAGDV
ncbi:hypothetical protein HDU76_003045 [Blyttiomyces sp. JEL0837]|nr:hypothetical protein HDU76_003045 [Blyttiomyces sp. JEL0837]